MNITQEALSESVESAGMEETEESLMMRVAERMGKKISVVKIHCSVLSLSYMLRKGRVKCIKVRKLFFFRGGGLLTKQYIFTVNFWKQPLKTTKNYL